MVNGAEAIPHWPTWFSVGLFPLIMLADVLLGRLEEGRMIEQFGEPCRAYRRSRSRASSWQS